MKGYKYIHQIQVYVHYTHYTCTLYTLYMYIIHIKHVHCTGILCTNEHVLFSCTYPLLLYVTLKD